MIRLLNVILKRWGIKYRTTENQRYAPRHTMLENIDRYEDIDCDGNYNMS